MNSALQPFLTVALPIMATLVATMWISSWSQNKRFDDLRSDFTRRLDDLRNHMNRRFDEIAARLERIERKLDNHEERIVRLEERTSPIHR